MPLVEGLEFFGYEETLDWLSANPDLYIKGFTSGFAPTDETAVEPNDPQTLKNSLPAKPHAPTRTDASTVYEQRILDHLGSVRRFSQEADTYYRDGSWRTVNSLTDDDRDLVDRFDAAVGCQPRQAYQTALTTAAIFGDKIDVVYVEGYLMAESFSSPMAHAWVELRGKVVELTLPEGPQPELDAAYFGIEYPLQAVRAQVFDKQIAGPLAK